MNFIVNSSNFCRVLSSISGILSTNNTVPVVNGFRFHLENNVLTITTTDLATTLTATLPVDSSVDDELKDIVVPAPLLLNILKSLDNSPAVFAVDPSNYAITIKSGAGEYRLTGRNADTYPEPLPMEEPNRITISASSLVSAINMTSFAANSEDDAHQQLGGIYCEIGLENTTFVSTDGHKLVRYRRNDITASEEASFILPKKPMNIVKGILSSNKEDLNVEIEYDSKNVRLTFGNYMAICRLIEGRYPNYEAAIPKTNPNKMIIDRQALLNTLRRVGLFANQSTNQVRMSITSDRINFTTEDVEFANAAHEELPCAYEGSDMEIGFNSKFIIEMLGCIDSENIQFELSAPTRPGIITPIVNEEASNGEDILMLVMPVALSY